MDFKAIKTFQTIIRTGSFNRAAEELNYAQSTVTMQIQKLEADVGVPLLERGKTISLTEAGRFFYEQSNFLLKDMERLQDSLTEYAAGTAGKVRLGATDPTASYRLPVLLQKFMNLFPKMAISVDIAGTAALTERLLRGELDMILCSPPEFNKELHYEPLFTEEFVLILPDGHPLTAEPLLTPDHLRGHRLLITASGCPYRKKLESVLQEYAGPPLDTMEIGSMSALKFYVEKGLGIALVPEVTLHPLPEGTVMRALEGGRVNMTSGIACRLSDYPLKPAGRSLYEFLKEELAEVTSKNDREGSR
ncbi:LysR family transcriptional regulator [Paenibacillus sp. PK3_47]|uniref:LysR family transcriptional regulator n=1 Tax=Paenibacillus sp. PK3_47 TaxID=2072642 RepID=UPI00201E40C8|nr:LysR family transcriptional regulator [Paenibacillus sp. PK3_47]UQZ36246.1 LysR family transcriptional regulator [Paenibacillus sp. PK3_47]